LTYQFHAVDFLGTIEDALDPRIARHPGMDRPLADKLDLAESCLLPLGRSRRVVALRDIIAGLESRARLPHHARRTGHSN
jgi:hypothetical protein